MNLIKLIKVVNFIKLASSIKEINSIHLCNKCHNYPEFPYDFAPKPLVKFHQGDDFHLSKEVKTGDEYFQGDGLDK